MGQKTSRAALKSSGPMGGDAGFTFMEVMVALALVASLMVTLAYTTNYNLDVAGRHEALTVVTMLARDKMDAVRRNPTFELRKQKGKFPEPFEEYEYQVIINEASYMGFPAASLTVEVTGRDETVSLRKIFEKKKVMR